MNILARLLSHGFAIAVVVLLAIGLVYRGELFPELQWPAFMAPETATTESAQSHEVPSETHPAEEEVESAKTAAVEPAGTGPESTAGKSGAGKTTEEAPPVPASEPPVTVAIPAGEQSMEETTAEATLPATAPSGVAETAPPPVPEEPSAAAQPIPSAADQVAADKQTPTTPAVAETGGSPPVESGQITAVETAPATAQGESLPAAAAEAAGAVPESPSTTGALENKRPYELLAAAREAYWMHDYDLAEANYRQWMELEPDNPDSYGELGNLFFSQGKWEEAADAYYEAGVRLVKSGHLQQASELLEVIRGLNGPQSEDLERLIKQAER